MTPLTLIAAALLLGVLAVPADAAGRLLCLPAAVLLAAVAARDLVLRPVLQADEHGLVVVSGLRRHVARWPEVEDLRLVRDRRATLLLLDLGSAVVVLSRLRLGRAPGELLEELLALRSTVSP